jgi:hypothetical protein
VFVGNRQIELARKLARFCLGSFAERKAQDVELLARGAEKEVALVALLFARTIERTPAA